MGKSTTTKDNTQRELGSSNVAKSGDVEDGIERSEGSSSWYNPQNGMGATIQIYEHEMQVVAPKKLNFDSPPPQRKKDDINRFSSKSRMRVLKKFNRVQTKVLSDAIFVTLTARHNEIDPEKFQNRFKKYFLPRLKEVVPNCVYAWRLEPHRDGYPHYHLFVWSWDKERTLKSRYYKQKIRSVWLNAIDDDSGSAHQYSCKIVPVRSHRKAMNYVSKYMAKEDELIHEANNLYGRRWGTSTNFPANPITEINVSYSEYEKLKKVAKRVLCDLGGHYQRSADFISDEHDWHIWSDMELFEQICKEAGLTSLLRDLQWYKKTGSTSPPDSFFEQYSDYFQ